MASLIAHLRQSQAHGRLAFHPDCPVCRAERLSGTLANHAVVTRRTHAAIVATVLAASTATPTIAVAQEPDQVSEGTPAPGATPVDPALNPDFDPGGDSADLPFDESETPESEPAPVLEAGDPGPLESEPVTDVDAPVADAGDEAAEPVVVSPSPTPTVMPTPTPVAPAVPSPTDGAESTGADEPDAGPHADEAHRKRERRHGADAKEHVEQSPPVSPLPVVEKAPAEPSTIVVAQETAPPPKPTKRDAATRGDRYHVVQPGESLWSIARDLVGHDASAARIAREVNRLWTRNSARIATGDPDLLMVDTKLALE